MSKSYDDYVNVLTDDEFDSLIKSINKRIDKKKYGETNFEDLALRYEENLYVQNVEEKNILMMVIPKLATIDIVVKTAIVLILYFQIQYSTLQSYLFIY